jgi:hypothetical protein
MEEHFRGDTEFHTRGKIITTARAVCHRVVSRGTTWVLSMRGPWASEWTDIDGPTGVATVLRSGRVAV